jgi:hypothetical protein
LPWDSQEIQGWRAFFLSLDQKINQTQRSHPF